MARARDGLAGSPAALRLPDAQRTHHKLVEIPTVVIERDHRMPPRVVAAVWRRNRCYADVDQWGIQLHQPLTTARYHPGDREVMVVDQPRGGRLRRRRVTTENSSPPNRLGRCHSQKYGRQRARLRSVDSEGQHYRCPSKSLPRGSGGSESDTGVRWAVQFKRSAMDGVTAFPESDSYRLPFTYAFP